MCYFIVLLPNFVLLSIRRKLISKMRVLPSRDAGSPTSNKTYMDRDKYKNRMSEFYAKFVLILCFLHLLPNFVLLYFCNKFHRYVTLSASYARVKHIKRIS